MQLAGVEGIPKSWLRLRTVTLPAVVAAASVLALAGCDPIYQKSAPVALRQHDGHLQVRLCEPLVANRIFAQSRVSNTGDWSTFFDAKGQLNIANGQTISSQTPPDELAVTTWRSPKLHGGDEISMTFKAADDKYDGGFDIFVHIPESGMPTSRWLHADSSVSASAC